MTSLPRPDLELLRRALRDLPASGPEGFEGLVRDLLSGLTDRRFFLASAGSQQGRDLSTGGIGSTWIAVEAKRYQKTTERKHMPGSEGNLSIR